MASTVASLSSASSSSTVMVVDTPVVNIKIGTSDGATMEFPRQLALKSTTLSNMLGDVEDSGDNVIPLNVAHDTMMLVRRYCEYHQNDAPISDEKKDERRTDDIIPWDKDFCNAMDQPTLFELILAANYLEISPLLDLLCKTVANMIKGKTPEELRNTFNLKNEFTPEEEAQAMKENEWCDDRT